MVPLLTELLGLPGIDVESYEVCEEGLILDVEAYAESAICPRGIAGKRDESKRRFDSSRTYFIPKISTARKPKGV